MCIIWFDYAFVILTDGKWEDKGLGLKVDSSIGQHLYYSLLLSAEMSDVLNLLSASWSSDIHKKSKFFWSCEL